MPNQCTYCDVISCALCHVHTYPAATQKGFADLCLYQLQCMCKCMCIPVLIDEIKDFFAMYVNLASYIRS